MAREEKLVIKLEDRMKFQVQSYADKFGVTMSALGAFIIGQWVESQNRLNAYNERVLSETASALHERANSVTVEEGLEALMKEPNALRAMFEMFAEMEQRKGQGVSEAGLDMEGHED